MIDVTGTQADALTLRSAQALDRAFLVDVYAETRADELALTDWTAEQRRAFVEMQFTAQDSDYRRRFPHAAFDVVLLGSEPVGRFYVDRRADAIHVLDIAIVRARQRRGIGTRLIRQLMDEAVRTNRAVSLYVEVFNPAQAWYASLGFAVRDVQGIHQLMTWRPA